MAQMLTVSKFSLRPEKSPIAGDNGCCEAAPSCGEGCVWGAGQSPLPGSSLPLAAGTCGVIGGRGAGQGVRRPRSKRTATRVPFALVPVPPACPAAVSVRSVGILGTEGTSEPSAGPSKGVEGVFEGVPGPGSVTGAVCVAPSARPRAALRKALQPGQPGPDGLMV